MVALPARDAAGDQVRGAQRFRHHAVDCTAFEQCRSLFRREWRWSGDPPHFFDHRIAVGNTPGVLTETTAEMAVALLFAAARAQHTVRLIQPALARGENVVCARYLDSSLAYQGAAYGIDADEIRRLQRFATYDLLPDLTILVDVPVEVGLARKRRGEWNRFEDTEGARFFETVRNAYLSLAAAEPERYRVVDGSGSVEATDAAIRAAVEPVIFGR